MVEGNTLRQPRTYRVEQTTHVGRSSRTKYFQVVSVIWID